MINRERVEELILARVWTAPKRVTKSEIKRAIAPFVEHAFSPAEWAAELDRRLAKLIAGGELSEQPLALEDRGEKRLMKALRISGRGPRPSWKAFKSSLGLARALGVENAKSIAGQRLAAFLLARRHKIEGANSVTAVVDGLLFREFGAEPPKKKTTLKAIRAAALAHVLGSEGKRDFERLCSLAVAEAAGSTPGNAKSLQSAVMRRWLSSSDDAQPKQQEKQPPKPQPKPQAKEQPKPPARPQAIDLPRFAKTVLEAASAKDTRRFGQEAFISSIWEQLRRSPTWKDANIDDFKTHLVEANRAGLLRLNRADLVAAMDEDDVARSETRYLNATFHFVELERRHP